MPRDRILVVEDDEHLRPLVQRVLSGAGFAVLAAESVADAIGIWQQEGKSVAVALVDVDLSGEVSGDQLIAGFKAEEPAVQFILMSGYQPERLSQKSGATVGFLFLEKPFLPSELVRAIRDAFQKTPRQE
jgi:DNA-binding NtrC family response regulator